MKYVIAARYNNEGKRVEAGNKGQMVLDCEAAREIVADLNRTLMAADQQEAHRERIDKAGDWL